MIPLASAAKRNKPRAKSVSFREIIPTKSQADDLATIYMQVVRHWRDVAARIVADYDPPALTTDTVPEIESTLTAAQAEAALIVVSLEPETRRWIERLALWHSRKWAANVLTGTGVNIGPFLSASVIADDMAASLAWNVGLIRNVSDATRDRIANVVWAGWQARTPRNVIARQMNEAVGISRDRARRIAIDQTTKLSAALDSSRMLEAGIDSWIWRWSHKLHGRKEHIARDGKRYTYQDAPDDLPGELPFCGCKKQAVLDL